jgi:uncharacterized protein (DUF2141 family)
VFVLAAAAAMLIGAAPVAQLDLSFSQLRSDKGMLRICVTGDPENFPRCVNDRNATRRSIPAGTTSFHLGGLPRGSYAVAVIHDENGNKKLDTFAGIPREGFGFSRNPPIRFGPPRFESARFNIEGDAAAQQVRLRYML